MTLTRRKFLVTAAASLAGGVGAVIATGDSKPAYVWRGAALGGEARVALYGPDPQAAKAALEAVAAEIARLEDIFSLHREASELSRLNAAGLLQDPAHDLLDVVQSSLRWRDRTDGAFNPLVQPLWLAAAQGKAVTADLLALVTSEVEASTAAIRLAGGAQLTLNGIAQGRIADRVTEILISRGFSDVVIDAGELRLPGKARRAVGIPAIKAAVSVSEVAIATSEPKSLIFEQKSFRHHLLEPRTGRSPRHWESISVFAPTAEMADALSTAFAVLPLEAVADLAQSITGIAVLGADSKGRVRAFGDTSMSGKFV